MINGKLENNEIQRLEEVLKIVFAPKKIFKKAEMAEFLGYKPPYFSGICNGKEKVTDQFLIKIQSNLGVNWNYVLTGNGEILLSPGNATAQTKEANAPGSVQNNTPSSAPTTAGQCAVDTSAFEIERLKSVCEERERTISVLAETNKNLLAEVQQLRNYVNITSTKYIQIVEKTLEAARQTNATVQQFQAQIGFHHAEQPHHTIAAHHNDKNH